MTFIVVIFVVAVAVGASSLWWIHKDELVAETATSAPAVAVEHIPAATPAVVVPAQRSNGEIRAWGRANGHTVSDRGPLPKALVAAYSAAHTD